MFSWFASLLGIPQVISSAFGALSSALQFLSPLLGSALSFLGWLLKTLWEGIKDIVDNAATVLTVFIICLAAWAYGKVPAEIKKAQCEAKVVTQKVYIEKQCKPKVIYKQAPTFRLPWED